MAKIAKVWARQILDSRGNPSLEVDVTLDNEFGLVRSWIPVAIRLSKSMLLLTTVSLVTLLFRVVLPPVNAKLANSATVTRRLTAVRARSLL